MWLTCIHEQPEHVNKPSKLFIPAWSEKHEETRRWSLLGYRDVFQGYVLKAAQTQVNEGTERSRVTGVSISDGVAASRCRLVDGWRRSLCWPGSAGGSCSSTETQQRRAAQVELDTECWSWSRFHLINAPALLVKKSHLLMLILELLIRINKRCCGLWAPD